MEWFPGISMQKYEANRLLTGVKYTKNYCVIPVLLLAFHGTTNYSKEGLEPLSILPFIAHLEV